MKSTNNDKKTKSQFVLRMPKMRTKSNQVRTEAKKGVRVDRRPYSLIDMHDHRIAAGAGMILGMLIVGLPHLIGVAILMSILAISLKLVGEGRL